MSASTEPATWYTRREGKVRGPYSRAHVTRYLLLGRIRLDDELSEEAGNWRPASECEELLLELTGKNPGMDDYQHLMMARISVDGRKSQRRGNKGHDAPPSGMAERRRGVDRRQPATEPQTSTYYFTGHEAGFGKQTSSSPRRVYLLAILLFTLVAAWFSATFR